MTFAQPDSAHGHWSLALACWWLWIDLPTCVGARTRHGPLALHSATLGPAVSNEGQMARTRLSTQGLPTPFRPRSPSDLRSNLLQW